MGSTPNTRGPWVVVIHSGHGTIVAQESARMPHVLHLAPWIVSSPSRCSEAVCVCASVCTVGAVVVCAEASAKLLGASATELKIAGKGSPGAGDIQLPAELQGFQHSLAWRDSTFDAQCSLLSKTCRGMWSICGGTKKTPTMMWEASTSTAFHCHPRMVRSSRTWQSSLFGTGSTSRARIHICAPLPSVTQAYFRCWYESWTSEIGNSNQSRCTGSKFATSATRPGTCWSEHLSG